MGLPYLQLLAVVGLIGFASPGAAKTWEFDCKFGRFDTPNGPGITQFSLHYHFDEATNEAKLITDSGFVRVTVHRGSLGVSFTELLSIGGVQTTTIVLLSGASVHSRHGIMPLDDTPIPAQYRGECTAAPGLVRNSSKRTAPSDRP